MCVDKSLINTLKTAQLVDTVTNRTINNEA